MSMVCPRCQGVFDQRWTCPACNVRLGFQTSLSSTAEVSTSGVDAGSQWQQTPWGRILIGLLVSQGLYYGLRQVVMAGLTAVGEETGGAIGITLPGLLILQAIQALGLAVAGVFAGAGQRQGIVYGAVLGVWNGVITAGIQSLNWPHTTVVLLGQPILHTAFGALGGFLGSRIWRPLPTITLPAINGAKPETLKPTVTRPKSVLFSGPIAWGRVLAGAALAVGGTVWANVLLELMVEASDHNLRIDNHLQAELVTWEVTALAMIAGAAVGGAGTVNSLKQGLAVGIAVSMALTVLRIATHQATLQDVLFTTLSSLCLGLTGAWFGAGLFPPITKGRRRGLA